MKQKVTWKYKNYKNFFCDSIRILKLGLLNKFIQKLQFILQYPNSDMHNIEDKIITIQ